MKLLYASDPMKALVTIILLWLLPLDAVAQSWSLNYSTETTAEQIVALSSPSDAVCWFLTNFDNLYKTSDGGAHWVKIPPTALSFNPSGLYVVAENTAFKSSSQNLYRTTNGGLDWSLVLTGSQFSPPVMQMKDADIGVAASGGILYKTLNSGLSWSSAAVTQPPHNIQNTSGKGNVFGLGDQLWVTQQNGGIAYSADFGVSWATPANTGLSPVSANARIAFANTNFGIAIKGNVWPYVYVTTDGGNNWVNTDNSLGANEDVVADGGELWYIPNSADHFYIKHSADAGSSWQIQLQLGGTHGFNILDKSRSGHVLWAGTNQGKLYRYDPALSATTFADMPIVVYPNPASDAVNFTATERIQFTLFDMLGTVVGDQRFARGDNTIDVSGFADGVYILRLSTASQAPQLCKLFIRH